MTPKAGGHIRRLASGTTDSIHRGRAGRGRTGTHGPMCRKRTEASSSSGTTFSLPTRALSSGGLERGSANAVLVKRPDWHRQRTLDAISMTRDADGLVISHRSGETEDSSIADLAVRDRSRTDEVGRAARESAPPSTTGSCESRKTGSAPVTRARKFMRVPCSERMTGPIYRQSPRYRFTGASGRESRRAKGGGVSALR